MDSTHWITPTELDARIERVLIGAPGGEAKRLIGIEYERLLVLGSSGRSATLADAQTLLQTLVEQADGVPIVEDGILKGVHARGHEVTIEPGGQVEVSTPPCRTLREADASIAGADELLARALAVTGLELLALGHAPVTPVAEQGLLARNRYRIMDARMPARGPLTRNMMRATAGFQVTLDFHGRAEAGRLLAVLYRISPLLAAWTANSREVAGIDSGYASYRHHVWLHTDRDRSAFPDHCLDPDRVIDGYIAWAKRAHALFLWRDGAIAPAPEHPFAELVARGEATEDDLALHMSSMFPFVRPRGHAEVRCMDSIPWQRARAIAALLAAVTYCPRARAAADDVGRSLVVDGIDRLRALHEAVACRGLAADAPDGRPLSILARELVSGVDAALRSSPCDMLERGDLLPLGAHEVLPA